MTTRKRKPARKPRPKSGDDNSSTIKIVVALIGAIGVVIAAICACISSSSGAVIGELPFLATAVAVAPTETPRLPSPTGTVTPSVTSTSMPAVGSGRLQGTLTDRAGNPISDVSVSIRNGPETRTDMQGAFVLSNIPAGDQLIVVKPSSGRGQLTQSIWIEENQTTKTNIVYDAETSRLGLLSITAPIDGGLLEVRQDGTEHRATVFGRCDGLAQVFDGFDIWVLIKSERDSKFWVQYPSAIIDLSSSTWRSNALLGDEAHPPQDGELWHIIAVAASSGSEIGRILNTPNLNLLPPHIRSNVVTVEIQIKR